MRTKSEKIQFMRAGYKVLCLLPQRNVKDFYDRCFPEEFLNGSAVSPKSKAKKKKKVPSIWPHGTGNEAANESWLFS